MNILDQDDFNNFFTECSELLKITIPYRFHMGEVFNPHRLNKNFQAVLKGIRKRIKKEDLEMAKTIGDMQQGVIRGLQDVGEYVDQMVDLNNRYAGIINAQAEEIKVLKAQIEALEKSEDDPIILNEENQPSPEVVNEN